jgi:hypothetical protein
MITSWTTTQNKILATLKAVTESEWDVKYRTSEQRHREGLELLGRGNFTGIGNFWNVWCHTDGKGHVVEEVKLANEMLGLPEEDLESVVKEIVGTAGN